MISKPTTNDKNYKIQWQIIFFTKVITKSTKLVKKLIFLVISIDYVVCGDVHICDYFWSSWLTLLYDAVHYAHMISLNEGYSGYQSTELSHVFHTHQHQHALMLPCLHLLHLHLDLFLSWCSQEERVMWWLPWAETILDDPSKIYVSQTYPNMTQ